jgi:probable HAF family extracellular repeat protein
MKSLGTLGGTYSCAAAINSKGQVVGASTIKNSDLIHAFIWQNGLMEDLGIFPFRQSAVARAINNSGQVVGNSGEILFLWENGVMQDVTTFIAANDPYWISGFELRAVLDINNVGQMLGAAVYEFDDEITRTYLMSPAYKLSAFLKPTINTWKRGSTVRIAIAVLDDDRVRIPDQRAKALQAVSCRVKVSAKGAQSLPSTCMNYNATTNEFWFEWKLLGTGTGTVTIDARVNYGAPGPLKVRKVKNITVTA